MEAISNTDRFVALLRQRLAEQAQSQRSDRVKATKVGPAGKPPHRNKVASMAAKAGADDQNLRRTIVEQLLSDRLGGQLANEPQFQQVVERVTDIIASDRELGMLLQQLVDEVRRREFTR